MNLSPRDQELWAWWRNYDRPECPRARLYNTLAIHIDTYLAFNTETGAHSMQILTHMYIPV